MNCSRQNLRLSSGKVAKDGDSPLENSKNHCKESGKLP